MLNNSKTWIGTSWKMNKTLTEAMEFTNGLINGLNDFDNNIQSFIIPPFTSARQVKQTLADTSVLVGAQNMHWEEKGAWTGEISPIMLKDCKLDIVELGHSERRTFFGETNETVGLKTKAALRHGLIPLICIGETLEERESGRADHVLETQVRAALELLQAEEKDKQILLAYEPIWAIGLDGVPATSGYADARHRKIIAIAREMLGQNVPCLYGGSVNPDNCAELMACKHIDGLFIGRSAWDVADYLNILVRCSNHVCHRKVNL